MNTQHAPHRKLSLSKETLLRLASLDLAPREPRRSDPYRTCTRACD